MRKALAAVAISALALAGCGGTSGEPTDTPPTSAESAAPEPTPSPSPSPTEDKTDDDQKDAGIEIEIAGDRVEPNGKRVQVEAGARIRLEIDSDRAGELHVHSAPEQEIPFKPGESVVTLTVDTPGIVDVEEHEADIVVLQLEVH